MVGLKIEEKHLILGTVVREDSIYSRIIIIIIMVAVGFKNYAGKL